MVEWVFFLFFFLKALYLVVIITARYVLGSE